jgi:predicted metal-dependent phosphoesterase TrpH
LIDLHTHTTASDGRLSPADLVERAGNAGVSVLSVTDHDTVAGAEAAEAACRRRGMTFVTGIEITAIRNGIDVHILGYFVDHLSPSLDAFLSAMRLQRVERIRQIVDRLAGLGMALDAEAILAPVRQNPRQSIGRPFIARALVEAGHATDIGDAFDRWLTPGRPAFVPRAGAPPAEVVARIHDSQGIASLAHPGLVGHDEWIPELAASGLDAVEAYHSKHDPAATARYLDIASTLGLAVSGGSDFHADDAHGPQSPGAVSLPSDCFERLESLANDQRGRRATSRARASGASTSS